MKNPIEIVKEHPVYTTSALVGVVLATCTAMKTEGYSNLIEGEVLEEKLVKSDYDPKSHVFSYVLFLSVDESEEQKGVIYTLNVIQHIDMPLPVVDKLISEGSRVWFEYLKEGWFLSSPKPKYPISRVGKVYSNELYVVGAGETSRAVRKRFGDKLTEKRAAERKRANEEKIKFYKSYRLGHQMW